MEAADEFVSLEWWKKKTTGVTAYLWDGQRLIVKGPSGSEIFSREAVEAVIFANFKP